MSVSRTSILRYWMLWKDGQRVTRVFCCPQIYHASASYRDQSSQGTASSQLSAVPSITPWAKSTPSKLPCTLVTAHSQFYKTRHHPLIWGHFSCPRHCSLPHCTSCTSKTEDTESRTYSILYLTLYVIIDLAAQQPSPRVPGDHFCCNKSGWEEAGHVCPVAPDFECLSMEVGCVNINFIAHPKEVP